VVYLDQKETFAIAPRIGRKEKEKKKKKKGEKKKKKEKKKRRKRKKKEKRKKKREKNVDDDSGERLIAMKTVTGGPGRDFPGYSGFRRREQGDGGRKVAHTGRMTADSDEKAGQEEGENIVWPSVQRSGTTAGKGRRRPGSWCGLFERACARGRGKEGNSSVPLPSRGVLLRTGGNDKGGKRTTPCSRGAYTS